MCPSEVQQKLGVSLVLTAPHPGALSVIAGWLRAGAVRAGPGFHSKHGIGRGRGSAPHSAELRRKAFIPPQA